MRRKVIITLFQKMTSLLWGGIAVSEILSIKIKKWMLTQEKFNKILRLQIVLSPKQYVIA